MDSMDSMPVNTGEPNVRREFRCLNRKYDTLLLAFKEITELQNDKYQKIKDIREKTIKELESI